MIKTFATTLLTAGMALFASADTAQAQYGTYGYGTYGGSNSGYGSSYGGYGSNYGSGYGSYGSNYGSGYGSYGSNYGSSSYGNGGYDRQRSNPGGYGYLLDFQNRGRPVDRYSFTQPWYGGSGYGTTRYGHRNRGGYDYSTPAYYANPRSGYSLYVR